jgi:hypothetical protein
MQRTNISPWGGGQKKKIKKGQEGVKEGNGDTEQRKIKSETKIFPKYFPLALLHSFRSFPRAVVRALIQVIMSSAGIL